MLNRGSLLAFLLFSAVYIPVTVGVILSGNASDLGPHLGYAANFGQGEIPTSYPLFHLPVFLGTQIGLGPYASAAAVLVGAQVGAGMMLRECILGAGRRGALRSRPTTATIAALASMLAFDIFVLEIIDGHPYLGGVGLVSYHNPTIIMVKPFAIAQFALCARVLGRVPSPRAKGRVVLLGVVTVLSGLAKPTFLICVVPASVFLLLAVRRTSRMQVALQLLLGL